MENGLRRQSYSAGGREMAQGNGSPKETTIFMAFCKNMNSQNIVPRTGFESLFFHGIFSIFRHLPGPRDLSKDQSKLRG